MRPENEWFKPEQLTSYFYVFEAVALVPVLVVAGVLAATGLLFEIPQVVVLLAGAVVVAAFGFLTWWIRAFYRTADYRLTDDEIEYRRGVFFRQKTTIPYNRITNVATAQGPIQRFVGAGQVGVHTAGYGGQMGAELTIDGIADYEEVKDQIVAKVRGRPAAATESGEVGDLEPGVGRAASEREVGGATPTGRDAESDAMLDELRRIRELLEQGRTA
ncbi:PH domain-containing protein [Halorussus salinus]|uniref:PH domain-containing protein n=1 Tax=Halorussus salinus TaxID=1364935 RepID=UPI00138F9493|nr:PH domain-containing protein [Halorussus salinus]